VSDLFDLLNDWPPSYAILVLVLVGIGYTVYRFATEHGKDLIAAYREIRRIRANQETQTNGTVYRDIVLEQNRKLLNEMIAGKVGRERETSQFLGILIDQQNLLADMAQEAKLSRQVARETLKQLERNERKDDSVWFLLTTILGASGGDIRPLLERAMENVIANEKKDQTDD